MAAKLVIPLRQERKEIDRGVPGDSSGSAPFWSMWRPRGIGGGDDEDDSWETTAFANDAAGLMGGATWPPRSYSCNFCRREFRSAQALGGHMNVHRRDRARLRQSSPSGVEPNQTHGGNFSTTVLIPTQEFPSVCFLYPVPNSSSEQQNPLFYPLNPSSSTLSTSQIITPSQNFLPIPPQTFMDHPANTNSNSNMVEFIPPSLHPSSPTSSPPSTALSISPYSPILEHSRLTSPPISSSVVMNSTTDSGGISGRRSSFMVSKTEKQLKQSMGAFHPYLPAPSRRDHLQNGSSEEYQIGVYNEHHAKQFDSTDDNDIDLELRLGQNKS